QALKYLARYTYRVAISNERIESVADGEVSFRNKDYARGRHPQRMTLSAQEFLRRFLQHVLPRGFVRIRSFGLLAHRGRAERLAHGCRLLGAPVTSSTSTDGEPTVDSSTPEDLARCPRCGRGTLWLVWETSRPRCRELVARTYERAPFDTS